MREGSLLATLVAVCALSAHAQAPPLRLGWQDHLTPVRAALHRGELGAAEAALAGPVGQQAPGLLGRLLEQRGDRAGACAVYAADARVGSPSSVAARLRHARCLQGGQALAAWAEVAKGPFAVQPEILLEAATFLTKAGQPLSPLLDGAVDLQLAVGDGPRRAALANVLLRFLPTADASLTTVQKKALDRLLDDLVETDANDSARLLPAAKKRSEQDPRAAALQRASVLEKLQDNERVIEELSAFSDDCEAALLLGKTWRKLRKYADSRRALQRATAKSCSDDVKKRALYLEARVAGIQKGALAAKVMSAFVDRFGAADPLSDDVLLWLGELGLARGDVAAARSAWERLRSEQPAGDMAPEARFRLAMLHAAAGDADAAIADLDDLLRAASGETRPRPDVLWRASYWRARLTILPDLLTLTPTTDPKRRSEGLLGLRALADSRGANWYGLLARRLIVELGGAEPPPPGEPRTRLAQDATLEVPATLQQQSAFALAHNLFARGYDEEAGWLLDHVTVASPKEAFAVALAFAQAGLPDRAHQTLRQNGLALLDGVPAGQNLLLWTLAWPQAHKDALTTAATAEKLPTTLLMGLAREESAFNAGVVSWAGARGLCQLMPPTAREEALAIGMPLADLDELLDPARNARLGAAHLGRRLRGIKNPILAVAAYNAGPGAVQKWMPEAGRSLPTDAFVEQIPVEETRNYVKKVVGSWATYAVLDGDLKDVRFSLTIVGR